MFILGLIVGILLGAFLLIMGLGYWVLSGLNVQDDEDMDHG